MRNLTPKQARFIQEYLVDLNAAQACIRAGYSRGNASRIGSELLKKPCVSDAIKREQDAQLRKTQVRADDVLSEAKAIAFSDIGEILDFSGDRLRLRPPDTIPPSARRALASVKVKRYSEGQGKDAREIEMMEFKFWPKMEALTLLAKHLGLLAPRRECPGNGGQPLRFTEIEINEVAIDPRAFSQFASDVLAAGGPTLLPDDTTGGSV